MAVLNLKLHQNKRKREFDYLMKDFFMWTIYFNPRDYPGLFVVRKFNWDKPTKEFYTAKTLTEARKYIPDGLINMNRQLMDDPIIIETWI